MEQFLTTIALIGTVIIVASLLSGLERNGVPLVAVFLGLGALLGPHALGLLDIGLNSDTLQILATLGLALVLFSDAVTIDIKELRSRKWLAWRVLGPGTLAPAAIIGLAGWYLLKIQPAAAALLGAALASTDPVMVRSVLRSKALPSTPRIALRLETGMNDVVFLPIIVISMLLMRAQGPSVSEIARHALGLLVLGPLLGAAVGWIGITILARVRDGVGVRRDYESLYALGLAFTGYAAAEAVGGSGFLAAFAAGLLVSARDIELCDCFLEYGEATAEMLLLLTFVAFGTSLIWNGFTIINGRTLAFAAVALFARTALLLPILSGKSLGVSPARPLDDCPDRSARTELAAVHSVAGVCRHRRSRTALHHRLSRRAALGNRARRRHRVVSALIARAARTAGVIASRRCAARNTSRAHRHV